MQRDNFNNVYQWLYGTDFGGWAAGAPPHIAGAGALAAQNAMSIQSRISRGDTFISLLQTNILDQDIKDGIEEYYTNTVVGLAPRPVGAVPPGPGEQDNAQLIGAFSSGSILMLHMAP